MPDGEWGRWPPWGQPTISRKEYEEGLTVYLQEGITSGRMTQEEADEFAIRAFTQLMAQGVSERLPLYNVIAGRHVTPQWWAEKEYEWQRPAYLEKARLGREQAAVATQRQQMEAEWQRKMASARQPWMQQPGGVLTKDLNTLFQRAEEAGVYIPPGLERGAEETIVGYLTPRIGAARQGLWQQRGQQALREQQVQAKQYPREWSGFLAANPALARAGWYQTQPDIAQATTIAGSSAYQKWLTERRVEGLGKGMAAWQEFEREAEQKRLAPFAEQAHKPARWAIPRQRV